MRNLTGVWRRTRTEQQSENSGKRCRADREETRKDTNISEKGRNVWRRKESVVF